MELMDYLDFSLGHPLKYYKQGYVLLSLKLTITIGLFNLSSFTNDYYYIKNINSF